MYSLPPAKRSRTSAPTYTHQGSASQGRVTSVVPSDISKLKVKECRALLTDLLKNPVNQPTFAAHLSPQHQSSPNPTPRASAGPSHHRSNDPDPFEFGVGTYFLKQLLRRDCSNMTASATNKTAAEITFQFQFATRLLASDAERIKGNEVKAAAIREMVDIGKFVLWSSDPKFKERLIRDVVPKTLVPGIEKLFTILKKQKKWMRRRRKQV